MTKKLTKKDIKKGDKLYLDYEIENGQSRSFRSTAQGLQELHPSTAIYFSRYRDYAMLKKAEPYEYYVMVV